MAWSVDSVINPSSAGYLDEVSLTAHAYNDGSFENDLPMQQLSELFNVNHFVVSQVNIHSAFLSSLFLSNPYWDNSSFFSVIVSYVRFLKAHLRDWLKNLLNMINFQEWGARRGLFQTLLQVTVLA